MLQFVDEDQNIYCNKCGIKLLCMHEYLEFLILFDEDKESIIRKLEEKYYVNNENNISCIYCGITINDEILDKDPTFDENNMLIIPLKKHFVLKNYR